MRSTRLETRKDSRRASGPSRRGGQWVLREHHRTWAPSRRPGRSAREARQQPDIRVEW